MEVVDLEMMLENRIGDDAEKSIVQSLEEGTVI
jgi:hypothetical protein